LRDGLFDLLDETVGKRHCCHGTTVEPRCSFRLSSRNGLFARLSLMFTHF
jgi:hypothetical protein